MSIWFELFLTAVCIILAARFGRSLGRSRHWHFGFIAGLAATTLVVMGHRSVWLSFVPPISWAVWPHVSPMLMGLAIPLMLGVLIVRLPERRKRIMVTMLAGAMLLYFGLMPLIAPLAARGSLLGSSTAIDKEGVCLQQHTYSCGPASAVTCLRVLGIGADEGAIAAAARTAPAYGTDGWLLASALEDLHPGIGARHCYVARVEDLRLPAIAAIRSPKYGGHYVAVLSIEGNIVMVGDPLRGREAWPRGDFLAQWTRAAIEISRRNE